MTPRRFRAPRHDGGLLADPPLADCPALAIENAARLSTWDHDFQGRRASWLRAETRREILANARGFLQKHGLGLGPTTAETARPRTGAGPDDARPDDARAGTEPPLIVTGHQPELFHPGVWAKNFAAAALARSLGGTALNLIVDNDLPKSSAIRVPTLVRGQEDRLARVDVEFDAWRCEVPFEDWNVDDEQRFATFGERVCRSFGTLGDRVPRPVLLEEFWPRALARRDATDNLGMRFSLARRETEAAWGVFNLELPLSAVCQSEGFLWYVAHLIAQLPRFQEAHNTVLQEYRKAHRIRSRHHPVAALGRHDDWLEAPFWAWRASRPRRRALLARQRGRTVELRIDGEPDVLAVLPLAPESEGCCAVERLRELPARGVRLRTRALTTTMFARFLLGDLFIHGIGGAKYDELSDELARRFFGWEPPGFMALSLTLRLGIEERPGTSDELLEADRRLRDLIYNPDRALAEPIPDEARSIISARRAAIARPATSRRERRARKMAIRRCNDALQPWAQTLRNGLFDQKAQLQAASSWNRVARDREYASVLHSTDRLRRGFASMVAGL